MIYFKGLESHGFTSRGATVHLFADAKEDVVPGAEIVGLPDGYEMEAGSDVYTGDFHLGILLSDGTWSWDDAEEASKASLSISKPALNLGKTSDLDVIEPVDDEEDLDEE